MVFALQAKVFGSIHMMLSFAYMRFRRGETWVGRRDDAIGGNPIGNIMIDHVSAQLGLDENMSMYRTCINDSTGKTSKK
jgi:hypothetical protein